MATHERMAALKEMADKVRVATAAEFYEVSQPAVWNWLRIGKLTRFKLGTATLVSLREIETLIAQGTAAAATEEAKQARVDAAQRRGQIAAAKTRSMRPRRVKTAAAA